MNPIIANIIASVVPISAGVLAGTWPRRCPKLAWLCFVIVCLLWASVIVPRPDGNSIGTRDEWLRQLGSVASLPFGIALGSITCAIMRHRANATLRGFNVSLHDSDDAAEHRQDIPTCTSAIGTESFGKEPMDLLRIPYVLSYLKEGCAVVEIHDAELRDMVEDHLIEDCDLEYAHLQILPDGGTLMVFAPEVSLERVAGALNKLDPAEVERVFRLNNPKAPDAS